MLGRASSALPIHQPAALFSTFAFATQLFRFSLSLNLALSSLLCGALFLRHETNDAITSEARSSFPCSWQGGHLLPSPSNCRSHYIERAAAAFANVAVP